MVRCAAQAQCQMLARAGIAAARFGVGIATSIRWMAALTTTLTVAARLQGRARRSKLYPHQALPERHKPLVSIARQIRRPDVFPTRVP